MLDFSRITGFDWDQGNGPKIIEKHGVSQLEAEQIFLDSRLLILVDEKHSGTEKRSHAYGATLAGRLLQVSLALREDETRIRIISARPMSRKERVRYEQEA